MQPVKKNQILSTHIMTASFNAKAFPIVQTGSAQLGRSGKTSGKGVNSGYLHRFRIQAEVGYLIM